MYGSNSSKEIDLRHEVGNLFYGATDEIAKGMIGLLRIMRRDSDHNLIQCACRNKVTNEPDRDSFCPYCYGFGYLWDEYKIVYYRNDDSLKNQEDVVFYFEWEADITSDDFIVEIKLDKDGSPLQPVQRTKIYDILSSDTFNADYGRVEFWKVTAKSRRNWSVWYGVQNRQHN
jgi:hypothetical protein